jgi:Xaa-Pro aminopeptidase
MKNETNGETKLIVAPSDIDADMLYATKFWAGDPFIFLQQNGKRTIVLSDLEMGRGTRTAKVDEFVSFNQLEREVQGKSEQPPPYEKVLAYFLRKRGVKHATVPANFALGYARELAKDDVDLATTNGLFWPEREAKTDE